MKSKRRHELQTNQLADKLGHWIERVRPYTTMTLVLAAGALLVLAAWYYLAAGHEKKRAESWRSYMLAGTNPQGDIVEELNLVADQFDDTQAGLWAALTAADIDSARGMRLMFTDRAAAETSLNLAKSRYREVLENKRSPQDALLSIRTHYGLAQAYEAQSELDEAKKQYALVVEGSSGSALGKAAQSRLDRLELATTKKWYNWFANQKPAPRNLETGPAARNPLGAPGTDLSVLPEGPSDGLPEGRDARRAQVRRADAAREHGKRHRGCHEPRPVRRAEGSAGRARKGRANGAREGCAAVRCIQQVRGCPENPSPSRRGSG